ncbi:hypothetical protein PIROE2DRAFT_16277 [Piromyces sp. E2]|nr:hypothetical protein PIROE2DRAFT_16277 [Piromyces sp. E2]|eukprot:OUM58446.1 hypothetical protein PIROE2DRAFT_16277 [Piromyces sp. E2]
MFSNKISLITLALLCVQTLHGNPIEKRDIYPVNKAFENICKVISLHPNGDLACKIGGLFTKDKYLNIVAPGQCERIGVEKYGITEICSSPPYQLYFKAEDYEVNGCYQMGEPHSTYMQCCQFRHAWTYMAPNSPFAFNAVAQAHTGTFCSGPKSGDASFKSAPGHGIPFSLNNNEHTLLYYKTKIADDICKPNPYSLDCEYAKREVQSSFDKEDINWRTVKKV